MGDTSGDTSRPLAGWAGVVVGGINSPDGDPFYHPAHYTTILSGSGNTSMVQANFDVARVWPVANEFSVANIAVTTVISF